MSDLAEQCFHVERATAFGILQEGRTHAKIVDLVENAMSYADMLAGIAAEAHVEIACKRGCSFCCHLAVAPSAPEIFRIVAGLLETSAPDELAEITHRLAERSEMALGLSNDDRFRRRIACAFLNSEGACSIYQMRPLACRGWHSLDAEVCSRMLDAGDPKIAVDQNEPLAHSAVAMSIGLRVGISDAGLDGRPIKLMDSVIAALEDHDLFTRWSAGEPLPDVLVDQQATAMPVGLGTVEESVAWLDSRLSDPSEQGTEP